MVAQAVAYARILRVGGVLHMGKPVFLCILLDLGARKAQKRADDTAAPGRDATQARE